jgi:hypothetical protein
MFQIPKAGNARLPSRLPLANRIDFSPKNLFSNDEPGGWFEANDASTLFTDVAGTTPVTTPGDAIALQLDKSQGLTLGPELVTNGTFDSDTDWTLGAGWSISGGVLNGATGVFSEAYNSFATTAGATYEVTLDITISSGAVLLYISNGGNISVGSTRTITARLVAGSSGNRLSIGGQNFVGTIDNVSVKELPGNHRTQATTAARPLYALHPVGGVRNLLQYTEEFDNAVWLQSGGVAVSANSAVAPDGTTTADTINDPTTSYAILAQSADYSPTSTASIYVKKDAIGRATRFPALRVQYSGTSTQFYDIFFDTFTGEYSLSAGASGDVIDEGDYWRVWVSGTDTGSNTTLEMRVFPAIGASSSWTSSPTATGSVIAWGAQLEEGSTATNYQRVGSFLDVSEAGKARRGRIWYNGTSHFMQTPTITPGTDKVQVFAGLRKLSDAASGVIAEAPLATGAFTLNSEGGGGYFYRSRGTLSTQFVAGTTTSPSSNILSLLGDISGDSLVGRIDGIQEGTSSADQGTGNYLAQPIYFGARAGTSLFFNGYEDTSIIRFGPNLDDTTISKVESYVASKTPEETI